MRYKVLQVLSLALLPAIFLAVLTTPLWATQPRQAREVLEAMGYTEVETGGYAFLACSRDDIWATKFTARGPRGRLEGVVCAGVFKGQTVRVTGTAP